MEWCSLNKADLALYLSKQLNHFFPDSNPVSSHEISRYLSDALDRTRLCLGKINRSVFHRNGEAYFDHLHSNANSMFLYLLSNTIFQVENHCTMLAKKLFYLNKNLNSVDVLWDTLLQEYFYFCRPLGTTLANSANYGNYFVVFQGCTVGGSRKGFPIIGNGVIIYTNSSVMGNCRIGDNVRIGAHSSVFNSEIPPNTTVFGHSKKNSFSITPKDALKEFFLF